MQLLYDDIWTYLVYYYEIIWGYLIKSNEPLPFKSFPYDFVKQLVDVSDSLQISIKKLEFMIS